MIDPMCRARSNSLLKNALVAFFNLAKLRAQPLAARRITTYVVILASHPCDDAGSRILQPPTKHAGLIYLLATSVMLWTVAGCWAAGPSLDRFNSGDGNVPQLVVANPVDLPVGIERSVRRMSEVKQDDAGPLLGFLNPTIVDPWAAIVRHPELGRIFAATLSLQVRHVRIQP